jgi:hypothetical protein
VKPVESLDNHDGPVELNKSDPFGDNLDIEEMAAYGNRKVLKDRHYQRAWRDFYLHIGVKLEDLVTGTLEAEEVDMMLSEYLKTRYNKTTLKKVN